ncbi:MAG: hypothetical protein Q9227_007777 [Pyrenula ochraceoflavens]
MKYIYERAERIFAWLGAPSNDNAVRSAVELMRNFNTYLVEGQKRHNDGIDTVLSTISQSNSGFLIESTGQVSAAWEGIAEIFKRPYWYRVWIYQEATTPGDIQFFCGNHVFDDILLCATIGFGTTFSKFPGFDSRFIEAAGYSSYVFSLSSARLARSESGSR